MTSDFYRDRVTLWCHRKWWVVPFLYAMLPPTVAVQIIAPQKTGAVLDFIGRTIGRYGFRIGIKNAD